MALIAFLATAAFLAINVSLTKESMSEFNYRVFVAGTGTVEGKWSGETGVAIIGIETRPAREQENELKVIDLLVANNSSEKKVFNSDIALINQRTGRFGLQGLDQPEVVINPGALSQGTVIISVPIGIPDSDWTLEIKGGNLEQGILLPLRVVKVVSSE